MQAIALITSCPSHMMVFDDGMRMQNSVHLLSIVALLQMCILNFTKQHKSNIIWVNMPAGRQTDRKACRQASRQTNKSIFVSLTLSCITPMLFSATKIISQA